MVRVETIENPQKDWPGWESRAARRTPDVSSSVYVWDRTTPPGACGVATKEAGAFQALAESLRASPAGAEGIVRKGVLPLNIRTGYAYTDPIAVGRHDGDGTIVWADGDDHVR